ncbi:MAG TPA: amidohydrolase family protein, partial [Actinomycetota bacterium]|nr:amidohydrolase family protein [Actinomycetota bacterium]
MAAKVLLRGGCVLTLGAKTPNFKEADLLIQDDRVAEVGPGIRSRDAEVVDAADTIVMPGFVDTHRHTRASLFRNLGDGVGASSRHDLLAADAFGPDDVYAATLAGLLGAVEAGITTVVDWADGPLDAAAVEAALQAHADAGLRTVFVAPKEGTAHTGARQLLERLAATAGPSTDLAVGVGVRRDGSGGAADAAAMARELNRRIHVHAEAPESGRRMVSELAGRALLGDDV